MPPILRNTVGTVRRWSPYALKDSDSTASEEEPSSSTYTCAACFDDLPGEPHVTIHGTDYCQDCFESGLKPQFETYLKDETKPVAIGDKPVTIDMVQQHFSDDFLTRYHAKMAEYAVLPPSERLYCAGPAQTHCGQYLGPKASHPSASRCGKCRARTCGKCTQRIDDNVMFHVCKKPQDVDPLEGLELGKDLQRCPKCQTPGYLVDGCNHVRCAVCKPEATHYCFICGKEVVKDGNHWEVGKPCPLYGQPGAANAIFDDDRGGEGMVDEEIVAMVDDLLRRPEMMRFPERQRIQILQDRLDDVMADLASRLPDGVTRDMLDNLTDLVDQHLGQPQSPEQILRDQYHAELLRLQNQALDMQEGMFNANQEFAEWLDNVLELVEILLENVNVLVRHQVTDATLLAAIQFTLRQAQDELPIVNELIGPGWQQFPSLRPMLDLFQLAVAGRVDELRQVSALAAN